MTPDNTTTTTTTTITTTAATTDVRDESAPLLPHPPAPQTDDDCDDHDTMRPQHQEPVGFTRATYFSLLVSMLINLSTVMLTVPTIALYEQAICQNHYRLRSPLPAHNGDDDPCKAAPVQSELALLRGWQGFFNGLSALLAALPLGYLADYRSHRIILLFIVGGMLAALLWSILVCTVSALPIRLVWMTSLFLLCGGGNYGSEMILAVMIVNSVSETNRTRALYYMYTLFVVAELVGPQLSKHALNYSIGLAFALGLACLVSCLPLLALMPETALDHDSQNASHSERPSGGMRSPMWQHAWSQISKRLSSVRLLFQSRNICFAIPLFLVGTFRNVSLRALLQYVSVRLKWSLANTNWLITEVASINLVVFMLVLPTIIQLINKHLRPPQQTLNLRIVQCCFAILTTGSICIGLSRSSVQLMLSLGLYATGFAARSTLLSLATSWFEKSVRARLYSAIMLLELSGMLTGEAIMQSILSASFNLPRQWMGVVFFYCAACYFIAFTSSFGIILNI